VRIAAVARLGVPVLVLAAVAACGPGEDASRRADADGALPAYEAPEDAPGFCSRLASVSELDRLPLSVGMLTAGADVEARTQISQVIRELRAVLTDVRADGGHAALSNALDDLVRALGSVVDGPLTDPVRAAVSAGLQQVGAEAQPTCGFPT
jgi:hypothetical protein